MTSFPNTDGPSGRLRRADDRSLPRVGIDRALIAPGETPSANGGSSARAEQLASFLDSVVGLGGTYLQIRARRAAEDAQRHDALLAEDARIADALEQQAAAVTKQKRGLGERDARAKLPLLQQEIAGDKLQVPPGADPVTFTREYLSAQFDGVDPEYQDAAVALIENDVVKAFADRQDELAKVAVKDSHNLMGEWAVDKTPAQVEQTIGEAMRYPGAQNFTEQDIRASVVGPAMRVAVKDGDVARVEQLAPLLGDSKQAAVYIEQAQTNKTQAQSARFEAVADSFRTRLYSDESTATIRRDLDKAVKNQQIDSGVALSLQNSLDSREKEREDKAMRLRVLAESQAAEKAITSSDAASAASARSTGGLATITQDAVVKIKDPSSPTGEKEVRVSAQERRDRVFRQEFPKLQSFGEQVEWLGTNNYANPEWVSTLNAGPSAAYTALLADPNGKPQIAKNTIDGYRLWKQLDAVSPGVRNLHANGAANIWYSRVQLAEKYITGGDEEAAIRQVLKVDKDKAYVESAGIDARTHRSDLRNAIGSDSENYGEAEQTILSIAKLYRDTGAPEKVAVDEATKAFKKTHTNIKGVWLYTGDGNLTLTKPEIEKVLKHVAGRYADYFGKEEDVEAGDLAFASTGTSGVVRLYNRRTNNAVQNEAASVPDRVGNETFGVFSYQDLRLMYDKLQSAEIEARKNALIDNAAMSRFIDERMAPSGRIDKTPINPNVPRLNPFTAKPLN